MTRSIFRNTWFFALALALGAAVFTTACGDDDEDHRSGKKKGKNSQKAEETNSQGNKRTETKSEEGSQQPPSAGSPAGERAAGDEPQNQGDIAGLISIDKNGKCNIEYGNDSNAIDCDTEFRGGGPRGFGPSSLEIELDLSQYELQNPPICTIDTTNRFSYAQPRTQVDADELTIQVPVRADPCYCCGCRGLGKVATFQCTISR